MMILPMRLQLFEVNRRGHPFKHKGASRLRNEADWVQRW